MRKAIIVMRCLNVMPIMNQPFNQIKNKQTFQSGINEEAFGKIRPHVSTVIVADHSTIDDDVVDSWLENEAIGYIDKLRKQFKEFKQADFYTDIVELDID